MRVGVLVVAKAPVPGEAKTRLGAVLGYGPAAELAAACLLDTLDAVAETVPPAYRALALCGDLRRAARSPEILAGLRGWAVLTQRGTSLGARLANAHADVTDLWGDALPVVQIGMDTPAVTAADLAQMADLVTAEAAGQGNDIALGPAEDGGWWALSTNRAGLVAALADVPMSRSDTMQRTAATLRANGAGIGWGPRLRDVDTVEDLPLVAFQAPGTRFARQVQLMGEVATS